ncbi:MAG: amidase [Kiloniellales bacterium]
MSENDSLGALVPGEQPDISGGNIGPLSGLTFVVKDNYDIAGFTTGVGNPDWARSHPPAKSHAWAVETLLHHGAHLIGKTITDELAYSVNGSNAHYGTPANVNAPGRLPGGSSSGSAAAVAGGLSDTALGSDTGGSVRVPASFCGLYGIRTTQGAIRKDGMVPLAPSFDTVGWFGRDAGILGRVGAALLPREVEEPDFDKVFVAEDAFALAGPETRAALQPAVTRLAQLFDHQSVEIAAGQALSDWQEVFRLIQAIEFGRCHRTWIVACRPRFAPDIAKRMSWALSLPEETERDQIPKREAVRNQLERLIGRSGLICLPTAPGPAPRIDADGKDLEAWRSCLLSLTAPAGLAGLPQVTLPLGEVEGCPVGLSLIAPLGRDRALLTLVKRLERLLVDSSPSSLASAS